MVKTDKKYDLEERTFEFAKTTRDFLQKIPKTLSNNEYNKQLIRSSSSVGANYIEANESLGKKDFLMRIRISRKEAKESVYWLKLLDVSKEMEIMRGNLAQEGTELVMILSSIMRKSL